MLNFLFRCCFIIPSKYFALSDWLKSSSYTSWKMDVGFFFCHFTIDILYRDLPSSCFGEQSLQKMEEDFNHRTVSAGLSGGSPRVQTLAGAKLRPLNNRGESDAFVMSSGKRSDFLVFLDKDLKTDVPSHIPCSLLIIAEITAPSAQYVSLVFA